MNRILEQIEPLERALIGKNFPPMSPWWRAAIERFYASGKRTLVLRVGRRGGKSSTLCRLAVLEALYGEHKIPNGDVGVVAIVSVSRDEAAARLRTIEAILKALRVGYRRRDDEIEIEGRPVVFKTFAATIAGVSGFTSIAVILDEVSKWRDRETGANPGSEVIVSAKPTMATMPNAKLFVSSSPVGREDAHAKLCELGNTDGQSYEHATSFEANPTLSAEQARRDEPEDKIFRREYLAEPSETVSAALDPVLVRACFRPLRIGYARSAAVLGFDSSMGRADATAWVVGQWWQPTITDEDKYVSEEIRPGVREFKLDGLGNRVRKPDAPVAPKPELIIGGVGAFEGRFADQGITSDDVVERVAGVCRRYGVSHIFADTFSGYALSAAFVKHQIVYHPQAWTQESKGEALARLRFWVRDGSLAVEQTAEGEKLISEMLTLQEVIRPSGSVSLGARRGASDDRVACVLNLALASSMGELPGAPEARHRGLEVHDPTVGRPYYA